MLKKHIKIVNKSNIIIQIIKYQLIDNMLKDSEKMDKMRME